jgi:multimeric flavodoxin WrbA
MYGHVEQLAQEITKGANAVEGVEATIYQVRFTPLAPLIALVMTQFFKQDA